MGGRRRCTECLSSLEDGDDAVIIEIPFVDVRADLDAPGMPSSFTHRSSSCTARSVSIGTPDEAGACIGQISKAGKSGPDGADRSRRWHHVADDVVVNEQLPERSPCRVVLVLGSIPVAENMIGTVESMSILTCHSRARLRNQPSVEPPEGLPIRVLQWVQVDLIGNASIDWLEVLDDVHAVELLVPASAL